MDFGIIYKLVGTAAAVNVDLNVEVNPAAYYTGYGVKIGSKRNIQIDNKGANELYAIFTDSSSVIDATAVKQNGTILIAAGTGYDLFLNQNSNIAFERISLISSGGNNDVFITVS